MLWCGSRSRYVTHVVHVNTKGQANTCYIDGQKPTASHKHEIIVKLGIKEVARGLVQPHWVHIQAAAKSRWRERGISLFLNTTPKEDSIFTLCLKLAFEEEKEKK